MELVGLRAMRAVALLHMLMFMCPTTAVAVRRLHKLQPPVARARSVRPRMLDALDLIPRETSFPVLLDAADATGKAAPVLGPVSRRALTAPPVPDGASILDSIAAAPAPFDLCMAVLLAIGLYLGPDFVLAPLGLGSKASVGYRTEAAVGRLLSLDEAPTWLDDRQAGLASPAPALVRAVVFALFVGGGYVLERFLSAVGSDNAVFYLGASTTLWGGLYEAALRPKLPSREERDLATTREAEFVAFAALRLGAQSGGTCHETDIVRAFRRYYPKYRVDRGITDAEISDLMRRWASVERTRLLPGGALSTETVSARTAAGYYKGITVKEEPDVGLG